MRTQQPTTTHQHQCRIIVQSFGHLHTERNVHVAGRTPDPDVPSRETSGFDPCVFQHQCRSRIKLTIRPPREHLAVEVPAVMPPHQTQSNTRTYGAPKSSYGFFILIFPSFFEKRRFWRAMPGGAHVGGFPPRRARCFQKEKIKREEKENRIVSYLKIELLR